MRAQQHLGLRDLPQLAEAFVGPRKEQNDAGLCSVAIN